jgi:hypothetical protein
VYQQVVVDVIEKGADTLQGIKVIRKVLRRLAAQANMRAVHRCG